MMQVMMMSMNMMVVRIVAMMVGWCKIGASKAESSRCNQLHQT